MKSLLLTFGLIVSVPVFLQARIITVSNQSVGGAMYDNIDSAYQAANNGDTIHLWGSNKPYELDYYFELRKSLTWIGIGINPDLPNAVTSTIYVSYNLEVYAGADSSRFLGIWFDAAMRFNDDMDLVTFENCLFRDNIDKHGTRTLNVQVKNSVFQGGSNVLYRAGNSSGSSSFTANNCVFDGYVWNEDPNTTMKLDHCLFLQRGRSTWFYLFPALYNTEVTNSIFPNSQDYVLNYGTDSNTVFKNNIFVQAPSYIPGSNNYFNTDPQFVNYTLDETYEPDHDYDVQPGSPAENAATDGTDIGVHGGLARFSERFEVLQVPMVREVEIQNTHVSPGGTLNVKIKASRSAVE